MTGVCAGITNARWMNNPGGPEYGCCTFGNLAADFTSQSPLNHVCIELSGEELTLFDRPLLGYACAGDPLFEAFLAPGVIGPHYRPPQAWLETAQTVVSFFLPFSQAVRAQNRAAQSLPSQAWLYGRVEGQRFVEALSLRLLQALQEAGFEAVAPLPLAGFLDGVRAGDAGWTRLYQQLVRAARRLCVRPGAPSASRRDSSRGTAWPAASAAWSPAGKPCPPPREYDGPYDWCIRCGACATRCPGGAISLEQGKNHHLCLTYQTAILPQCRPRFGCGLCQTGVPCEVCPSSLPVKTAENPPDGRSVCFGHSAGFAFLLFGRIAPRSACLHPCPLVVVPFIFATRLRAAPECFRLPPDRGSCA